VEAILQVAPIIGVRGSAQYLSFGQLGKEAKNGSTLTGHYSGSGRAREDLLTSPEACSVNFKVI